MYALWYSHITQHVRIMHRRFDNNESRMADIINLDPFNTRITSLVHFCACSVLCGSKRNQWSMRYDSESRVHYTVECVVATPHDFCPTTALKSYNDTRRLCALTAIVIIGLETYENRVRTVVERNNNLFYWFDFNRFEKMLFYNDFRWNNNDHFFFFLNT